MYISHDDQLGSNPTRKPSETQAKHLPRTCIGRCRSPWNWYSAEFLIPRRLQPAVPDIRSFRFLN